VNLNPAAERRLSQGERVLAIVRDT
jgi:hypothetical protein